MSSARPSSNLFERLETRLCFSSFDPVIIADDLTAIARSSQSVELQWSDLAVNEVAYNIYRSTDQLNWERVAKTPAGSVSWIDNTAEPDTDYFYTIRAFSLNDRSQRSNIAMVTTLTTAEDTFAVLDDQTGQLTVRGTPENDEIHLTSDGIDTTVELNGVQLSFPALDVQRIRVYGQAGHDKIVADPGVGAVYLSGGDGNDTIYSSEGRDYLDGGAGDDLIKGGANHDTITGGLGNDTIYGQAGNDLLRGGEGFDRLLGGDGHDTLFGDSGNDRLYGQGGNDSLNGGGGLDLLDPG